MQYRGHCSLTATLCCSLLAPQSLGRWLPGSWCPRDCAAALALTLAASGLVDLDSWVLPPHRRRSPFHWPEVALACLALGWLLWRHSSPWGFGVFYAGLGWCAHLSGDLVQGGLWSPLWRRRWGLVGLNWQRYQRWSPLIDGGLCCAALLTTLSVSFQLGWRGSWLDLPLYPPAVWGLFMACRSERGVALALAAAAALYLGWLEWL